MISQIIFIIVLIFLVNFIWTYIRDIYVQIEKEQSIKLSELIENGIVESLESGILKTVIADIKENLYSQS